MYFSDDDSDAASPPSSPRRAPVPREHEEEEYEDEDEGDGYGEDGGEDDGEDQDHSRPSAGGYGGRKALLLDPPADPLQLNQRFPIRELTKVLAACGLTLSVSLHRTVSDIYPLFSASKGTGWDSFVGLLALIGLRKLPSGLLSHLNVDHFNELSEVAYNKILNWRPRKKIPRGMLVYAEVRAYVVFFLASLID